MSRFIGDVHPKGIAAVSWADGTSHLITKNTHRPQERKVKMPFYPTCPAGASSLSAQEATLNPDLSR